MSRHRIFTPVPLAEHAELELAGSRAHYLANVLRARPGDSVTVFDGSGSECTAVVAELSRKRVLLDVGEASTPHTESTLDITLVQSVIRPERMDFCVQKATELGVSRLIPIITERTVIKLKPERAEKRREHWHNIALSACEQSGRVRLPSILLPGSLGDAIELVHQNQTPLLVLDPWADAAPLHHQTAPAQQRIALCVGPEGGFTDGEIELLRNAGATPVTCGPRILRSETAGVVAVAASQMAWGDWNATA